MRERLREFVAEHGLIPEGARVLVGYSGGADSTCLLHLLHEEGFDVVAAHLNHAQRPEAEADARHCAAFAESLGIPYVGGSADVPALSRDRKVGLEEAGRLARYAFFDEAAAQTGCARIATAHTRSDLAETVVFNLARGTGLAGLAGIPVQRDRIVRPLLFASRQETTDYCAINGLQTITDSGNDDDRFARVRIRKRILPELRSINEKVEDNIANLARIVDSEDRFLDGAAAAALEQGEIPLNGDLRFLTLDCEAAFRRDYLLHLPPVLLRRALRLLCEALGGNLDYAGTENAARLIASEPKGSLTALGGEVVVTWQENEVRAAAIEAGPAFEGPVAVPGTTYDPARLWKLEISLANVSSEPIERAALAVPIDVDAFRGPLHFRAVRPGDAMRPIGAPGKRKLSDLLGEAGLTLLARRRLPILCDIIGPLWAPGVTLDERARPAPGADKALRAVFGPFSE